MAGIAASSVGAAAYFWAATGLRRVPIFSTDASITSPGLRKIPRAMPTPVGVPVAMMSPGRRVRMFDK